ncbi:hypothetical protein NA56DRAFT_704296 [Hyaloscypha hepaticicola]|uniref:Uncharacterized protein n=1 Tax=Hyaloscypha hepaticicola TaxID=2082293 RepID=A0A2J6Q2K5_9HELO|nr:hypothetical protein NA56DRAFT_704296 [Hyaloscypha hepaticicola]
MDWATGGRKGPIWVESNSTTSREHIQVTTDIRQIGAHASPTLIPHKRMFRENQTPAVLLWALQMQLYGVQTSDKCGLLSDGNLWPGNFSLLVSALSPIHHLRKCTGHEREQQRDKVDELSTQWTKNCGCKSDEFADDCFGSPRMISIFICVVGGAASPRIFARLPGQSHP